MRIGRVGEVRRNEGRNEGEVNIQKVEELERNREWEVREVGRDKGMKSVESEAK